MDLSVFLNALISCLVSLTILGIAPIVLVWKNREKIESVEFSLTNTKIQFSKSSDSH